MAGALGASVVARSARSMTYCESALSAGWLRANVGAGSIPRLMGRVIVSCYNPTACFPRLIKTEVCDRRGKAAIRIRPGASRMPAALRNWSGRSPGCGRTGIAGRTAANGSRSNSMRRAVRVAGKQLPSPRTDRKDVAGGLAARLVQPMAGKVGACARTWSTKPTRCRSRARARTAAARSMWPAWRRSIRKNCPRCNRNPFEPLPPRPSRRVTMTVSSAVAARDSTSSPATSARVC